jgi:DNA-binding MarR family transcriptional regulator
MQQPGLEACNCFAVRKAARSMTQTYDAALAPSGVRVTQFMILMALNREDGLSVNKLAELMVMNRTTMGKNLRPLERDGLVDVRISREDRRSRDILLTRKGRSLLDRAYPLWRNAHDSFERKHGAKFAEQFRSALGMVAA